jgi:hypothetical protein
MERNESPSDEEVVEAAEEVVEAAAEIEEAAEEIEVAAVVVEETAEEQVAVVVVVVSRGPHRSNGTSKKNGTPMILRVHPRLENERKEQRPQQQPQSRARPRFKNVTCHTSYLVKLW